MDEFTTSLDELARSPRWLSDATTPHTHLTAQERAVLHRSEKQLYRLIIPNLFKLPPKLYHYTNERGIDGILSSGGIRATYSRDLLDEQEIRWGIALVNEAMQFFRRKLQHPQLRELLGLLYYAFVEHELSEEYYIACFTESGDSERHWTEYGFASSGFAIEFDSFSLQRPSAGKFLDLQPVIYSTKDQASLISDIILISWSSALELVRSTPGERYVVWLPHIMSQLTSHLHFHLSLMKRDEFAWEKEWRVIVRGDKPDPAPVQGGAKRFSHLSLLKSPDMAPITAITARHVESAATLRDLVRLRGYRPIIRPA